MKMNLLMSVTIVGCTALAVLAPNARADERNRRTVVTFSAPVEIPPVHLTGWAVLPAGTYVFKILDNTGDRHIVQIFSEDETHLYATILAIPNYRMEATDKTVITFSERPVGRPAALHAWFYPGRNTGDEFVYPRAKAQELARSNRVPILFTPIEMPLEVNEPAKLTDEPVVTQLRQAPVLAIAPTGEEVQLADVVTPAPVEAQTAAVTPEQAPAPTTAEKTLPKTGGSLPLIGMLGLMALGGSFAVRRIAANLK